MMRLIVIDADTQRVLKSQDDNLRWWVLTGACKRCGKCCVMRECKCVNIEMIDGKKVAQCMIESDKPYHCKIYPSDVADPLYDGCGYKWVEVHY